MGERMHGMQTSKGESCEQIMAALPLSRLKTSLRAFSRTALDFGGPYITEQGRGKSRQKGTYDFILISLPEQYTWKSPLD